MRLNSLLAIVTLSVTAWFGWMHHLVFSKNQGEQHRLVKRIESLERIGVERSEEMAQLHSLLNRHLQESIRFHPLKERVDPDNPSRYVFMSRETANLQQGSPELFHFPHPITSNLLCFVGNNTRDGTRNLYAFAPAGALPPGAVLLPGTSLISDSTFDFSNPWHSMYNLVQFVQWRMDNGCASGERLLLYHWGELRQELGDWIRNVFLSNNLTTRTDAMEQGGPVCFERAVMSRTGIGGVSAQALRSLFDEVRCQARRWCEIRQIRSPFVREKLVQVTLVIRDGNRGFRNSTEWIDTVKRVCESFPSCRWSTIRFSELGFCQQVQVMSRTDVLLSVHGAQLTNMIFMSPGSRILEVFPKGWLQLAGHGQFIYKHLADWVGLQHEGFWRDEETRSSKEKLECPSSSSIPNCFTVYKNRPVGINTTFISHWLATVLNSFLLLDQDEASRTPSPHCRCSP